MKYEEFKEELYKQINVNSKYFNAKETQTLNDFAETINKDGFENKEIK